MNWSLEEARRAGQLELGVWRSLDPRVKAAKAEKAALRRQRRRRKRMGVFIGITETAAPGGVPEPTESNPNKRNPPMSFRDDFGSPYLNATEFGPIGTSKRASISRVVQEPVGREREKKWVAYLTGADGAVWKGLILNMTNGRSLLEGFGSNPASYAGRQVEVRCEPTSFGSTTVGGLRLYPLQGAADALDDEIPFQ
jgi:hypothetical protein